MPSRRPRPRRLLLPTLLAAVLVAEITGLALARTVGPTTTAVAPVAAVASGGPSNAAANGGSGPGSRAGVSDASRDVDTFADPARSTRGGGVVAGPPAVPPASPARATKAATASPAGSSRGSGHAKPPSKTHHGTNRVWIPSLGISKGIQSFSCARSRAPDAGVYRWGCAGHNNLYRMGHAWSTFKPLHDAYVGGRLRKGMQVLYADGSSHVHTYTVVWWKVVAPTTAASWAWASLSKPSMTLQTCVGSRSQFRLMVRLVETR
jgi:sortase (surface protein transpeptidase)